MLQSIENNYKHVLDTKIIASYLREVGILPKDFNTSLSAMAKYFNIEEENSHNAFSDVLTTLSVLNEQTNIIKKLTK